MDSLHDLNAFSREPALLAKPKYVDTCTRSDRRKEEIEGSGRAGDGRLICRNSELTKVRIDA